MGEDDVSHSAVGILDAGLRDVLIAMQLRRIGVKEFTIYENANFIIESARSS